MARWNFESVLKKHQMRHLLQVKRKRCLKNTGSITGFVVGFSNSLILLHNLDMDVFQLNGYTAIRDADISQYRVFDKADYWQYRAVKQFQLAPVKPPAISVASLPDLLTTAAQSYPLLTIRIEEKKPDVCYIGSLVSVTQSTFTIEDLDCNGEWSGPRRIRLADVTKIDFDGGYERALLATLGRKARTTT